MGDKYHSEVCQDLIKWFLIHYPGWYLFPNPSGYASVEHVRYGIPTFGGGFDYVAFGPMAQTEFFEVKTNRYPTLSGKQKRFAKRMTGLDFKCWVFREDRPDPVLWMEYDHRSNMNQGLSQ